MLMFIAFVRGGIKNFDANLTNFGGILSSPVEVLVSSSLNNICTSVWLIS